jgi:hypothetical protein
MEDGVLQYMHYIYLQTSNLFGCQFSSSAPWHHNMYYSTRTTQYFVAFQDEEELPPLRHTKCELFFTDERTNK